MKAVIKETIVATIGPIKLSSLWFDVYISITLRAKEAIMIGMDNNIEKIAADSLFTFNILAPVMVTPALLAPGIKAKTWKKPIMIASKKFKSSHFLVEFFFLSAKYKMIPKIILDQAITIIFLK